MNILKPGEKLIAKETDYSSGSIGLFGLGVNDAYDLYLVQNFSQDLILVIFMKIQFFFQNSKSFSWSTYEEKIFTNRFKSAINNKWGNKRLIKTLSSGKKVFIDFRFETQIAGWSINEHWEIYVKKIRRGSFSTSSVNPLTGNVFMDSEDFSPIVKLGGGMQRGVVHEFGHMLGLADEYLTSSRYRTDVFSIMNGGEKIRSRHDAVYLGWLDRILTEKRIK